MIERSDAPRLSAVRAELSSIVATLEGRQAGKLQKFMDKDFEAALSGLDNLIQKLSKTSRTLNPQDEAKGEIESSLTDLHKLRSSLSRTVSDLESVNV